MSAELASLLGLEAAALCSHRSWCERIHVDDRAAFERAIEEHVGGGTAVYGCTYRLQHRDGSWVHIVDRGSVVRDETRPGSSVMEGCCTEITAEREQTRHALDAARAKTHILATVSHELRTPLNAILGLSEALLERAFGPLAAIQEPVVATIHESGKHLLSLINDILEQARVDAAVLTLSRQMTHLEKVIDAALTFVRAQAHANQQQLRKHVSAELPPLYVDARRLKQVLLNLLTNAMKFSPPSSTITIRAALTTEAVVIAVEDEGPGVHPQDHERIFEPFFTIEHALTREHDGVGLGLSLSRGLVVAHGGTLQVESEPGHGAKFVVRLPLEALRDEPRSPTVPAVAPRPAPLVRARAARAQTKVLIFDADATNRLTLQTFVELHGYDTRVIHVDSVRYALDDAVVAAVVVADERADDVIVTIAQLRGSVPQLPIIVVARTEAAHQAEAYRSAGATTFMLPPLRLRALGGVLDRLTRREP